MLGQGTTPRHAYTLLAMDTELVVPNLIFHLRMLMPMEDFI